MSSQACDADRTRNWMVREGGARAAFLDARETAPDSSSSLMCTWREHGLLFALRQWIESHEADEASAQNKLSMVLSKGMKQITVNSAFNEFDNKKFPFKIEQ